MNARSPQLAMPQALELVAADGYRLAAHLWPAVGEPEAVVVINPATAVKPSTTIATLPSSPNTAWRR